MARRSPGQKLINISVHEDFVRLINEAVAKTNYGDRSRLIRDAIVEKLERLGMEVPPSLTVTPPRFGKGGRRRKDGKDRKQTGHS
jgi:hypothetical protein